MSHDHARPSGRAGRSWDDANQAFLTAARLAVTAARLAGRTGRRGAGTGAARGGDAGAASPRRASRRFRAVRRSSGTCCCSAPGWSSTPRCARACAQRTATALPAYATFSLALAALPGAHWSAIAPASALRRWHLVELGPPGAPDHQPAPGRRAGAARARRVHYLDPRRSDCLADPLPAAGAAAGRAAGGRGRARRGLVATAGAAGSGCSGGHRPGDLRVVARRPPRVTGRSRACCARATCPPQPPTGTSWPGSASASRCWPAAAGCSRSTTRVPEPRPGRDRLRPAAEGPRRGRLPRRR